VDRNMTKSSKILLAYCFAIYTIHQVSSLPFPLNNNEVETGQSLPLVTIKEIEEIIALNDAGEKMKLMQKYGVETVQHLMKFSQNTIEEVDVLVKESEIAIRNLKAQAKDLDLEQFNFTKNFISKFNDAKLNLLEARRELVSLASETVLLCDNIEIGIRDWQDEHAAALLKNQFTQLRRLIDETKIKLSSAREKYADLINTWLTINEEIATFKLKLNRATDTNTDEYESWTTKIRTAYISSASAVTAGMIIADIFGCLGICSGVVTTGTWIAGATTAETAIAKYGVEIKSLEEQVDKAIASLGNLDQSTEAAIKLMTKEMNLVITWQAAAKNVENTINDFTYEQMQAIKAFQNIFANSIGKLKSAAKNFYDFASSEKPALEE